MAANDGISGEVERIRRQRQNERELEAQNAQWRETQHRQEEARKAQAWADTEPIRALAWEFRNWARANHVRTRRIKTHDPRIGRDRRFRGWKAGGCFITTNGDIIIYGSATYDVDRHGDTMSPVTHYYTMLLTYETTRNAPTLEQMRRYIAVAVADSGKQWT